VNVINIQDSHPFAFELLRLSFKGTQLLLKQIRAIIIVERETKEKICLFVDSHHHCATHSRNVERHYEWCAVADLPGVLVPRRVDSQEK